MRPKPWRWLYFNIFLLTELTWNILSTLRLATWLLGVKGRPLGHGLGCPACQSSVIGRFICQSYVTGMSCDRFEALWRLKWPVGEKWERYTSSLDGVNLLDCQSFLHCLSYTSNVWDLSLRGWRFMSWGDVLGRLTGPWLTVSGYFWLSSVSWVCDVKLNIRKWRTEFLFSLTNDGFLIKEMLYLK